MHGCSVCIGNFVSIFPKLLANDVELFRLSILSILLVLVVLAAALATPVDDKPDLRDKIMKLPRTTTTKKATTTTKTTKRTITTTKAPTKKPIMIG